MYWCWNNTRPCLQEEENACQDGRKQKKDPRKLKIVKIDNELRVVMIKGAVPGKPGNLLLITPAKIVGKNIPKN